jgi:beta-N-acetylhexosaminidase
VAAGVAAFIDGAHRDPKHYVLVTAKHFPGHGDTAQDSHVQLATLDQPRERVEQLELVPFRAAIEHGVDAVMTAHMAVPAFDPERLPATLSRSILTGLLRDELGFKGLVVTDALEMQGIAGLYSQGEAAIRAVEAGTDVLLMPTDPDACIRAIQAAVKAGKISRQRIDASAAKILAAKEKSGLLKSRVVNLDSITDNLADQKLQDLAQQTADHAFTLVKDDKHLFPLPSPEGACLVVMTEDDFSRHGDVLVGSLRPKIPNLKSYLVSSQSPPDLLADVVKDVSPCKEVYAAAFVTVSAYRGSVALQGGLDTFLKSLTQQTAPVALISMGNPYLLRDYSRVTAYAATFSSATTSERAAAQAILGEIPIDGKLPISIPGAANIGDGLNVPVHNQLASTSAK